MISKKIKAALVAAIAAVASYGVYTNQTQDVGRDAGECGSAGDG